MSEDPSLGARGSDEPVMPLPAKPLRAEMIPQTPADTAAYRARQRSRAVVMGLALGAFAVLMFLISIAKMAAAQ